jgi:hypothetical protein
MRTFLALVPAAAFLLLASCSVKERTYGAGGTGGKGSTTGPSTTGTHTTTTTSSSTATGMGGMGGAGTSTTSPASTSSSSSCTPKSCTDLGLSCGKATDNCNNPIDCGFCPDGEVCGTSTPNVCGTSAACSSYASNLCNTYNACAPDVVTYQYGSVAECVTRYSLFCSLFVSEPETAWTEAKAQACGNALAGLGCQAFLLAPFDGGPPACQPPAGPRADGMDCIDAGQCASAYCQHTAGSWCGTCVTRGGVGAACTTFSDCQSGLACASGTCATALQTGASCTVGANQCALGLYCQGGTCQPPIELGGSCMVSNAVCNPLEGLYCNTNGFTCKRAAYAAAGQPCGIIGGGITGCTAAAICTGSTCTAPAADGAACDLANHVGCTNPAACINGKCTLGDPGECP